MARTARLKFDLLGCFDRCKSGGCIRNVQAGCDCVRLTGRKQYCTVGYDKRLKFACLMMNTERVQAIYQRRKSPLLKVPAVLRKECWHNFRKDQFQQQSQKSNDARRVRHDG